MNFFEFFLFYIISTIIFFLLCFFLYKVFFKKLIYSKFSENALLSAFDDLDHKSILDIDSPKIEEDKKDEKIYTYF